MSNNQPTDRKESAMIPDRLDKHEVFQFLRPDQLRAISDVAVRCCLVQIRRRTLVWSSNRASLNIRPNASLHGARR
jgi:hypothetical protein